MIWRFSYIFFGYFFLYTKYYQYNTIFQVEDEPLLVQLEGRNMRLLKKIYEKNIYIMDCVVDSLRYE